MAFVLEEASSICPIYQVGSLMRVLQAQAAGLGSEGEVVTKSRPRVICKDERSPKQDNGMGGSEGLLCQVPCHTFVAPRWLIGYQSGGTWLLIRMSCMNTA